jgi:yecA family protein
MLKLSYQAVENVVAHNDATISAAEAHGILAGMLCANHEMDCEQWLSQVFDEARDHLTEGEVATMRELYDTTRELLEAVDFSFELFLPDDHADLVERAQALSGWCQGFLYGIGYGGAEAQWTEDCAEVLRDLADISRLDANASGEADEVAYTEISEFVRVGVQLVRGDLWQPSPVNRRLH